MKCRPTTLTATLLTAFWAAGCGSSCPPADLHPLETTPAYAVITSDYTATAIALLDQNGELVTEAWVDSATTQPGLVTALSGDVTLPTGIVKPGALTWIDRGQDAIARVAMPGGTVLDQTSDVPPAQPGQVAFKGNPQDVVRDTGDQVWISRFEPNSDSTAPPLDRGNDLVLADLSTGQLLDRIALDGLDTEIMESGSTIHIYARPSRMVAAGPRLVVGLSRLDLQFQAAGPGAVAIVDTAGRTAIALHIPKLENCGEVAPVQGDDSRVLVDCLGFPYGDQATAGVAQVHVAGDGTATVDEIWHASDHPSTPVITGGLLSLGGTRLLGVAAGDTSGGTPDRLIALDLGTGATTDVYDAQGAFTLGDGAYDPGRSLVLWTDTDAGIVRFDVIGNAVTYRDAIVPSPCRGLPALAIAPLQ